MTIFSSFSANFPSHYHTILAITILHSFMIISNELTRQIDGKNDNSVVTVIEPEWSNENKPSILLYLKLLATNYCPVMSIPENV